jgi:hypothetical protein
MKTLVAILQYNTFELTDSLFKTLKPYEEDIYDLIVVDNGSDLEKRSKYTNFTLEENVFYGGGLNAILEYFLENKQYDSVMVLNNDILCHGEGYVKELRDTLFNDSQRMVVSPCVLEPHLGDQSCWKQMRPWYTSQPRKVPWVDFQAPLLRREFVEYVGTFPNELIYGWGQDVLTGMICEEKGWDILVHDGVPTIHLISQTINQNPEKLSKVNQLAEQNMFAYFKSQGKFDKFTELRTKAFNYDNIHNKHL